MLETLNSDLGIDVTPIVTFFAYGLIMMGLFFAIAQAGRMMGPRGAREHLPGLGVGLGAVAAGVTLMQFATTSNTGSSTDTPSTAAVPVPAPTPAPEPVLAHDPVGDTGGGFDPLILLVVLGVLGALGLAALVGFSVRRRILDRREERRAREQDWATARAVYTGVLDDYAAYLADPYAWLDRPILEDVDEPCTAAFLGALGVAQSLDLDIVPTDPQRIERFRAAATALRAAWDQADRNARTIGTTIYEPVSRGKLRRAAGALRTALDESATAEERESAAAAVRRLTDGLVSTPRRILEPITAAIEAVRRKELPVGRDR